MHMHERKHARSPAGYRGAAATLRRNRADENREMEDDMLFCGCT